MGRYGQYDLALAPCELEALGKAAQKNKEYKVGKSSCCMLYYNINIRSCIYHCPCTIYYFRLFWMKCISSLKCVPSCSHMHAAFNGWNLVCLVQETLLYQPYNHSTVL